MAFNTNKIEDTFEGLKENGELPDIKLEGVQDKRKEDLKIFSRSISELTEKVHPDDDDQKALAFALEFENSGYRYYENMLKQAKDQNLIKLLNFLLSEEGKHAEAITRLQTYLEDSANWFMYEEGSFPQG